MSDGVQLVVDDVGQAAWSDGLNMHDVDQTTLEGIAWTYSAMMAAVSRVYLAPKDEPFLAWSAAVEGAWWGVALDEALNIAVQVATGETESKSRYARARNRIPQGEVIRGLKWVRNRHGHEMTITRTEPEFSDFYGRDRGQAGGPPFHLFVPHVWKSVVEINPQRDKRPGEQQFYEKHFAGQGLRDPLLKSRDWFDLVLQASRFPPLLRPERLQ